MSRRAVEFRVGDMRILRQSLLIALMAFPAEAQPVVSPPNRAWLSGGLGLSSEGVAATASASCSRGPIALIGRLAAARAFSGDQLAEKALLIRRRTAGNSRFSLAAIGVGRRATRSSRVTPVSCGGTPRAQE